MSDEPSSSFLNEIKGKKGLAHLLASFKYSCAGLLAALSEAAFRQLLVCHGVLIILAVVLDFDITIRMVLIMVSFLSWVVELFNTAIEATVDYISQQRHPLAKKAKDTASAAQLITMTLTVILWAMALWHTYACHWF